MKLLFILFNIFFLYSYASTNNTFVLSEHIIAENSINQPSSGVITNNIIKINVNGMVCDFCAQSIEKVFMKRDEVKGINVNLENQKVIIYLKKGTNIKNKVISIIFEDAGYTIEKIKRIS